MSNYQGYSDTVEIAAGMTSTINADLAPSPNPGPFASLEIDSVPSGASVFLDDQMQGITPVTISSVPSGRHTISIRMTGYSDYSTIVQLSPGQSALISTALAPVPTPVPTTRASSGLLAVGAALVIAAALVVMKRYRRCGKQ